MDNPLYPPLMSRAPLVTQNPKIKKLEWYANQLVADAVSKEKSGQIQDAMKHYLQAADILLLLAKGQDNYAVWKSYSDKAAECQKRVKLLIATRRDT